MFYIIFISIGFVEINEPFTIVQPMPRKELSLDSTIGDAIGPTSACMLTVEIGPGGRVAIQDLTDLVEVNLYENLVIVILKLA